MNDKGLWLAKRAKSFVHAGRGLKIFLRTTHNAWIQIMLFLAVLMMGAYFEISADEWLFLVLGSGLVLTAEAINTAIEIDVDLTSPTFHPHARDAKDVAAGAVLIAAAIALIIGIIIFAPRVLSAFFL
jgi:diacylglycerol kinase